QEAKQGRPREGAPWNVSFGCEVTGLHTFSFQVMAHCAGFGFLLTVGLQIALRIEAVQIIFEPRSKRFWFSIQVLLSIHSFPDRFATEDHKISEEIFEDDSVQPRRDTNRTRIEAIFDGV